MRVLVVDRYIGRYLPFFKYRHEPISFSVWPMCWNFYFDDVIFTKSKYLKKKKIPNAQKLPRIRSGLFITVFSSFLIIFLLNIFVKNALPSNVFLIHFQMTTNVLNMNENRYNYISHPVFQDIGGHKNNIGKDLETKSMQHAVSKACRV